MIAPLLKPLWTYDDVVAALGGKEGVGKLTRQPAHAVNTWRKQRGKFPTKYYFAMKGALADAGYRAPIELWGFYSENETFSGPKQAVFRAA
jgi:hypothetical protein